MTQVPLPVPDELTAGFWAAAREGVLAIQRCAACGKYQHPPAAVCLDCGTAELTFEPVSGRGRVFSYTETHSGARHPAFSARTPYLVGVVELDEQPRLLMYTNFPGATLDQLRTGARVTVQFETLTPEISLPQFRLVAAAAGEHTA